MIKINNLNFFYEKKQILKIKNLNLDTSKISVLMGSNGSGKSTLLRILSFLEGKFKNIYYFGKNNLNNEEKRQIFLLFAEPILLNRSIKDNFLFAFKTYKIHGNFMQIIKDIFEKLQIDINLLNKMPNELSSGQIQKISIAIALSIKAKYYLLDEPTSFLDKNSISLVKKVILQENKKRNCGFLIASHDKFFLDSLADKKLYLHDGEILEFENTNIFDINNEIFKDLNLKTNLKKIAINPYKIKINENLKYKINNCKIIAIRTKKEFIYIRVIKNQTILELALNNNEFFNYKFQIYDEINLSFDNDGIYFLN